MRVDPGVKPLRIRGLTKNWAETDQEINPRNSLGGDVQIVGFDEADQTLQAVTKGTISGTVVQDPSRYGYESIRVLAALARGDHSVLPPRGFLDIPARRIRLHNVARFWADLETKLEGK